jgi:indolepyruvate ferredoxin oxidoreductase, beta subunit
MTGTQPIKIAVLAMGGEGGGVLADWIVDLGEKNDYLAQTTSVPGVAQRTGATIYYVELYPRARAMQDGGTPVLALMPLPGDVDVVLASELMEAGRAVQRGLVTRDRTTLIASTHRVYSISEKSAMGDGRVDSAELLKQSGAAAKRFVCFDMAAAADAAGSVISAVLFGALAGTGVLPFSRGQFEATIKRGGVGVDPSLRAFDAAFARAAGSDRGHASSLGLDGSLAAPAAAALDGATEAPRAAGAAAASASAAAPAPALATASAASSSPASLDPLVRSLLERVHASFPADAHATLVEGVRRTIDYQDPGYASLYLDRMARIGGIAGGDDGELINETARHLALWMTYEDTIRVAQLKTRASRFDRVRGEVRAKGDQVIAINEFMHPRLQEICETLPSSFGRWLLASGWPRRLVERLTRRGRIITTSSLRGFMMLYAVAAMKRWRRSTLRFQEENELMEQWLRLIETTAAANPQLAIEVAQCQRLVKGYSETHERGLRNYGILRAVVERAGVTLAPATLRELRESALADEHGEALRSALVRHALA